MKQVKRFIIIGIISTLINYALFALLFKLIGIYYIFASVVGYLSGFIFGYIFNRSWTFSSIEKFWREFIFYFLVYFLSLLLGISVLKILVEIFNINPLISNLLIIGLTTIINFLGCRLLVFNKNFWQKLKIIYPYFNQEFFGILIIKISASLIFASTFVTNGFLPFINYFIKTLLNPYQYFAQATTIPFPYPVGMLFITSAPFLFLKQLLPIFIFQNTAFQFLLLRGPIIVFDVLIYLVLCYLLPSRGKDVLWLYFASPILFYINYVHGQLDVIPTAFLFLSLLFLFRKKELTAFGLLGLGIATKTHLLAVLPFYLIYLYRNKINFGRIGYLFLASLVPVLALNIFYWSPGFMTAIFNNPEQQRIFNLFIPFGFNDLKFFLAPAALLLIFYKFFSYKKLNADSLILIIGLIYTVLISLVPPMQGWFYWSLPFLIFFFIKFQDKPILSFWGMNFLYLAYFLLPLNNILLRDILFTALEASLLMNILWVYKKGVASNELYQEKEKSFVMGIGGDSGVGKSTLTINLLKIVGNTNAVCLNGDDVHKWERGHEQWQLMTHLNPKSNLVHVDLQQTINLLNGKNVERSFYDHATGKFTSPKILSAAKFIICQGLLPFILEKMRPLYNLKIYLEADEDLRIDWKLNRDLNERGYEEQKIREQINQRRADAEKFIYPQKDFADWIIKYNHDVGGGLKMEYLLRNSIAVDKILDELSQFSELSIAHNYLDMNFHRLVFSGSITKEKIQEVAYKVFPNLFDLVENYPEFENDFNGINQLFFINYLDSFYRLKI